MTVSFYIRIACYVRVFLLELRIRISIIFGSCIRIRTRVKGWIRIRVKVKIHKLFTEVQNSVVEGMDARNGGLETQNVALEGL
jgi:hypothetical protein